MFIDKDSIIIDGISMGEYIVEAKYGYNKLWGQDSGRNLAGKMCGTLVGVFPKIVLQFRHLNKSELERITPILDKATQTLTYYDPTKKRKMTITTYTGDYEISNKNIIDEYIKNDGFSCSFIAINSRG